MFICDVPTQIRYFINRVYIILINKTIKQFINENKYNQNLQKSYTYNIYCNNYLHYFFN